MIQKKKILISIGGFLPAKKFGGPVVSINNFCDLFSTEFDLYIVTRDTDLNELKRLDSISDGWNIRNNCKVVYLRKSEMNKSKLKEIIDEICPDIIYINSFFDYFFSLNLLSLGKKKEIPILIAPRGELCENAFNLKRGKKIIFTLMFNLLSKNKTNVYFQSTSQEETLAIKQKLKVPLEKIFRLDNIPTTKKVDKLKKKNETLQMIFLSRIHPKKNLSFALNVLSKVEKKVVFDIYGPIEDKDYWNDLEKEINSLSKIHDIEYKGEVETADVHETFSKYDIFFFPTLSENYGHVIVEALYSNCKVLLSNNTPWDDIEENNAGWIVDLKNEKEFIKIIEEQQILKKRQKEIANNCYNYISGKTDRNELKKEYISIIKNIS